MRYGHVWFGMAGMVVQGLVRSGAKRRGMELQARRVPERQGEERSATVWQAGRGMVRCVMDGSGEVLHGRL